MQTIASQPASTAPAPNPAPASEIPLWLPCLEVVFRFHRMPLDMRTVARHYALTSADNSPEPLLRVAKDKSFRSAFKKNLSIKQIAANYRLPAIQVITLEENRFQYLVWFSADQEMSKALVFDPQIGQGFESELTDDAGEWIVLFPRDTLSKLTFGLQWFFQEVAHYKLEISEVLTGSFVVQLFGLATPLLVQIILDKVLTHRSLDTLDVIGAAFIGITIFEVLLNLVRNNIFNKTASKVDVKLGTKLFRHLLSLPFGYFDTRKVGDTMSKVRELETIRTFITQKAVSVLIDLSFSSIFILVMMLYSVQLTLIVISFIAIISIINVLVTPPFKARLEEKFQMAAKNNSFLIESLTGVQTVKSLAIEGMMQRKWEDNLGNYIHTGFNLQKLVNVVGSLATVFQRLMTIAVLYFGVRLVLQNQMTVGQLIAFNMFAGQLTTPILRLVSLWHEIQQVFISVDRVGDILNHPSEPQHGIGITRAAVRGAIKFDKVSFKYGQLSPAVLNELSFDIPPGTSVGVVGRSGSGKSTLTKLVQQLYTPNAGAIYIDGTDGKQLNSQWLRSQIGVVLQENFLFSGTIRENISMARPEASAEVVIEAAMLAGAHEFITEMPAGYETMVEERGASLSGGQRQRIAIARALIVNPRILILDEATSALDYESERIIRQNLTKIKQGRTVIIIAHRISTVQNCDNIIVLDKGKLVEQGTHTNLLAKGGLYHYLFAQQEL